MELKFYQCPICGKIVAIVKNSAAPTVCCGKPMEELVAGTTDAAREKHVPEWSVEGDRLNVVVGAQEHPMKPEHYIEWIALETNSGVQVKTLRPGAAPRASFALDQGDDVRAVYAYCNLHSLWKS